MLPSFNYKEIKNVIQRDLSRPSIHFEQQYFAYHFQQSLENKPNTQETRCESPIRLHVLTSHSERMMRIILLRHGKPVFELKGYVRGSDLGRVAKSYELSGIVGSPPIESISAIQGSRIVVCSHLLRSIESATALGCSEVHAKDPLFCETPIPYFDGRFITMPITAWTVLLRIMWIFGFSKNGESLIDARKRAEKATERLIELAETHQNVLLVGHGFINHFIAQELKRRGWLGPSRPSSGFWGYGIYERATQ